MSKLCSKIKSMLTSIYNKLFVVNFRVLVLGLPRSGKTSLIPAIFEEEFREVKHKNKIGVTEYKEGNINFIVYDIPGSRKFRHKWDYYYRKCDVLLYCCDLTSEGEEWEKSKEELKSLLYRNIWYKKNMLVLGTYNDLEEAQDCKEMILKLGLLTITDREIACYSVSSKDLINIELIKPWLVDQFEFQKGNTKLRIF